jgi:hypothetical protein
MSPRGRTFAVRFIVPLLAAGMLGVVAPAAVTASSGPSWTVAILAGIALAIAAGLAGIAGGRATMRAKLSA